MVQIYSELNFKVFNKNRFKPCSYAQGCRKVFSFGVWNFKQQTWGMCYLDINIKDSRGQQNSRGVADSRALKVCCSPTFHILGYVKTHLSSQIG